MGGFDPGCFASAASEPTGGILGTLAACWSERFPCRSAVGSQEVACSSRAAACEFSKSCLGIGSCFCIMAQCDSSGRSHCVGPFVRAPSCAMGGLAAKRNGACFAGTVFVHNRLASLPPCRQCRDTCSATFDKDVSPVVRPHFLAFAGDCKSVNPRGQPSLWLHGSLHS